jgi:hypothetical protein
MLIVGKEETVGGAVAGEMVGGSVVGGSVGTTAGSASSPFFGPLADTRAKNREITE